MLFATVGSASWIFLTSVARMNVGRNTVPLMEGKMKVKAEVVKRKAKKNVAAFLRCLGAHSLGRNATAFLVFYEGYSLPITSLVTLIAGN